ncbi:tyrosine decarboxylase MfnA [Halomarina oriensis]|uniref:Probable L-aspartate decarboxylase n=1 Tax=Halomarina oriensis TaxID=671145 RepID=A0A6B0GLF6_9EURY|nr:tyrosine decarboxylase MfnA [Halomarina oriensis]MWG35470.1 tyrosine decarboxylase MfnA [Halomarina oriensis]
MQRPEPQEFARVLSSMCTEPHPAARAAAERFLATNPGDPGTYGTVADLEREAVDLLGEVTRLPDPTGYVTSGGTEANIQAIRIARNRTRDAVDRPNVVVPDHAHFSFSKAADLLSVELRRAPLDEDYRADLDAMAALVDADTVGVVGVAGSTEYGRVDPIPDLAALAEEADALFHVDAAWGGFALPFTEYAWDFADAAVDTMTIDPHKLGQAAIPAGGLLARSSALFDTLAVDTPYLESTGQVTLTGTRSGAGVASAVAAMRELWADGYRTEYERAQALAEWFADELRERGYDVVDPTLPLVAAALPEATIGTLREAGWRLSKTGSGEARVVVMPHVTRGALTSVLADLDRLG